ncbi:MAG: leucine--tRNA ligase [Planctomycetota bacterium]|jgi:leucyl-tRNA synthetase
MSDTTTTPPSDSSAPAGSPGASGREPAFRYTGGLAGEIETRWQAWWAERGTFVTANPGDDGFDAAKPKYFVLDMFPYPSGAGLHVGHPEGYTATDIVARYMRMRGRNVLHPMGFDAFGLPAEQYAIETGIHPRITTQQAIDTFRRQLQRFGFSYDWSRDFATIDPDYYRWTQWIWLEAYHSWYDAAANRARPIAELLDDLQRGRACVGPDGALIQSAPDGENGGRAWSDLSPDEARAFLDDRRLAYIDEQTVNWCPNLGTVLANEEVIDGRSERGGHPVLRRPLRQWMFRITAYAERLLADLDLVEWPESTRTMQAEWIGRSEGAEIDFPLVAAPVGAPAALRVYTTRPDTVFGATYMVVAPEHPLVENVLADPPAGADAGAIRAYVEQARHRSDVDRMAETKEKTGVDLGATARNPANGKDIPVWVADYVLMGYGHGAIMAVPGHDQRDHDFARTFDLPITQVVKNDDALIDIRDEAYEGDGTAVRSANDEVSLDGLPSDEATARITEWLESTGRGRGTVNYRLRDWLFSRQRYWGEPVPVVFDSDGHHHPVDAANLPVLLPDLEDYEPAHTEEPSPLLAKVTDWVNTTAGAAGVAPDVLPPDTPVTRETNTMPGWAGSCWYYLRFCDVKNTDRFVSREAERYWMVGSTEEDPHAGVDLYIGGAEHAVLHLLYARFWHKLLYDLGEVSTVEPFTRLFHQGMILSHAYQRADKSLVPIDEVQETGDGTFVETATGDAVTPIVAKMSKSLRNVVNPDDIITEYGADTFRLYEMYMGPLEAAKPWNTRDIVGVFRFLQRVWRLAVNEDTGALTLAESADETVERALHRTIAKAGDDIERLAFNTAIASMIEFVNAATSGGGITRDQLERFVLVLAPFTPHIAEELWSRLGHEDTLTFEPWPAFDESMLRDESIEMPVQIMGKVRGRVTVPADASEDQIREAALAEPTIARQLEGKTVRKVIVVQGRIVNIVAG